MNIYVGLFVTSVILTRPRPVSSVTSPPSFPCRLLMIGLDRIKINPFLFISGIYRPTNETVDGFPVFEQEYTPPGELPVRFLYNETIRQLWFVTAEGNHFVGAVTGGLQKLANDSYYPLDSMINGWYVWNVQEKKHEYREASSIRPRCIEDDVARCQTRRLELTKKLTWTTDSGNKVNISDFEQLPGVYRNYRPVFKAVGNRSDVYLYHLDGNWKIGPSVVRYSFQWLAQVWDDAFRPEYITGTWYKTMYDYELQVRCQGLNGTLRCGDVRCLNGATCVDRPRGPQCLCPGGFSGLLCEHAEVTCPNPNTDWSSNPFYYGVVGHQEEGAVATWFCVNGSRPAYGPSVCTGVRGWSDRPECSAPATSATTTTTTTRTSGSATDPPGGLSSGMRWLNENDYWLVPLLATLICVAQPFAPLVVYCVLFCCFDYNPSTSRYAQEDAAEDGALAAKYRTELEEFERLHPEPEERYDEPTIAELTGIQSRLERDLELIRTKRFQRDRGSKRKKIGLCRTYSSFFYVSFWFWVVYIVICASIPKGQIADIFIVVAIIGGALSSGLLAMYFLESKGASEKEFIEKLTPLASVTVRVETMRLQQPLVAMSGECYHYETRYQTVYYRDAYGNQQSRTESYKDKVVTRWLREYFDFEYWFDRSETTIADVRRFGITKIRIRSRVAMGDSETADELQRQFEKFKAENAHWDEHLDCSIVDGFVPGAEERLTAYVDPTGPPWWMTVRCYWAATFLLCGWPYRWLFNRSTGYTEYNVVKVIFVRRPPEGFPQYEPTARPPSTPAETATCLKSRIRAMIEAARDPSVALAIPCVTDDQHVNIELKRAVPTPRQHAPAASPGSVAVNMTEDPRNCRRRSSSSESSNDSE